GLNPGKFLAAERPNVRVIVNYGNLGGDDWITEGYALGARPMRPGELRFGASAAQPILGVATRAAAAATADWSDLELAAAAATEPARLEPHVTAGRLLRTPKFTLQAGKLHYLVRGSGFA